MTSITPLELTSPLYPNNTDIIDDNFENLNNGKQELALTSLVGVNLNTIITNGKYCASATCTNLPESGVKTRLIVNVDPTNSNLAMQEALTTTTLISYVRTTANGGSTWTAWARIKANDETKQDTLVNGTNIKSVNGTSLLGSGNIVTATLTGTETLTNKRITRRVVTVTQSATPTINTDNGDIFNITGLAQAITSFTTNLTGTPVDGDMMIINITDNGTSRSLTFGTSFEASTIALPTTTVISTLLKIGFQYNGVTSKWRCVAVC